MSRDKCVAFGQAILDLVRHQSIFVRVRHAVCAITKISDGRVLQTCDGDRIDIHFDSQFGSGLPVNITVDYVNDTTLDRVLALVRDLAPPRSLGEDPSTTDPDDPVQFTFGEREFPSVALWHDATFDAMQTARGETLPALVDQLQSSALTGAVTVGLGARAVLYLYRYGLTAFAQETDSAITVTARTQDGTGSGWSGQASRDWTQLRPAIAVARAADLARLSQHAVTLEPGVRTVILGPAAVAQLVSHMSWAFDGRAARSGTSPFSAAARSGEPTTKLGQRVLDDRLMLVSDPADPLGGYPPFYEQGGVESRVFGYPTAAITWIDRGRLVHLAYGVADASMRRLPASDIPFSVRLAPAPGIKTATIDEMIAQCQEGIYVNRFTSVSLLDGKTGMLTGATRDGCFLVKKGKLEKPIRNFRFLDSPFLKLNTVEMIGTPERVALGYDVPTGSLTSVRWPPLPIIVPPLMIRDFNFVATTDAV